MIDDGLGGCDEHSRCVIRRHSAHVGKPHHRFDTDGCGELQREAVTLLGAEPEFGRLEGIEEPRVPAPATHGRSLICRRRPECEAERCTQLCLIFDDDSHHLCCDQTNPIDRIHRWVWREKAVSRYLRMHRAQKQALIDEIAVRRRTGDPCSFRCLFHGRQDALSEQFARGR